MMVFFKFIKFLSSTLDLGGRWYFFILSISSFDCCRQSNGME